MITHLEIGGFKSFVDFSVDVPPFVALLGSNASGKSNLVDALRALVDMGEGRVPGAFDFRRGAPTELFHQREDGSRVSAAQLSCEVMTQAPELGGTVGLDFLARMSHETEAHTERVRVTTAVAGWAPSRLAAFQKRGAPPKLVSDLGVTRSRLGTREEHPDISGPTPSALYGVPFERMSDGRQRAMWLIARELRSWHFLSLAPAEMRNQAFVTDDGPLESDGGNLAAVLGRMRSTDAMWDLVADGVALIPGLRDVHVVRDRDYWEFELEFRGTGRVSPHMASDGTLRVLAILAALHDPDHPGVLVLDEIENGLHPALLIELLRRIRAKVTDWRTSGDMSGPLRQVIFSTHSPVVLAELFPEHREDLVFLSTVFHPWAEGDRGLGSLITRARSVGEPDKSGTHVSVGEVRRILESVRPLESAG